MKRRRKQKQIAAAADILDINHEAKELIYYSIVS
ncbi:hypothetical protein BVRB_9g204850 [Beta vulgaris subsp. vulgaris]|nr:hypothetical protein BVRB_9g204850 [Beta vulgaris subsp. vulgaris]